MNITNGQLHQAFASLFVTNSGGVSLGGKLKDLASGQIGVFRADQSCVKGDEVSLTAPNFATHKRLVIKQGVPYSTGTLAPGLSQHTIRPKQTIEFEANQVISWTGIRADRAKATQQRIAIGYDGIRSNRTLNDRLDAKPLHVNIILQGEPIKRFFGRNRMVHRFVIDKGFCGSDCECLDTCGKVSCDLIADKIVNMVNTTNLFSSVGGRMLKVPLRQFISANKVKKCVEDPDALSLTQWKKWQISIQDDGMTTIALLQQFYPALHIEQESRTLDGRSTYYFWQPTASADPADFTINRYAYPVCDVCPDCPEDTTAVNGAKVIQYKTACGASAPTLTGVIGSPVLISSSLEGGNVYIGRVAAGTSDATIASNLAGCISYTILGIEGKQCLVETATFEWTSCDTCNKTTKQYMITLPDLECGLGSRLAALQAAYPELTIAIDKIGTCMHTYSTTISSECVPDSDCGRLVDYPFQRPAGYMSFQWEDYKNIPLVPDCDVPEEEEVPCCVCGVVFETAAWDTTFAQCATVGYQTWNPSDKKPVLLQVNIHSLDWSNNPCDETKAYSTVLQELNMNLGTDGVYVQEMEMASLNAYEGKKWSNNPFVNEVNGFLPQADPSAIYDQYILRLRRPVEDPGKYILTNQQYTDFIFYVKSGQGKQLENLINRVVLTASAMTGNKDLKAVVL